MNKSENNGASKPHLLQALQPKEIETTNVVVHQFRSSFFYLFFIKTVLIVAVMITMVLLHYVSESDTVGLKSQVVKISKFEFGAPLLYYLLDSCLVAVGISAEPLNLLGGYLFGHLLGMKLFGSCLVGTIIASVVCIFGTISGGFITYVLGRTFLRERAMKLRRHRWWRALDNIIDRNGVYIVTAIRFCPLIPFAVLNLFLGSSSISPIVFLISLLGCVPFCIFVVTFGSRGKYAITEFWSYPLTRRIIFANVLITIILSVVVMRMIRSELKMIDRNPTKSRESEDVESIVPCGVPDAIMIEQGPIESYHEDLLRHSPTSIIR